MSFLTEMLKDLHHKSRNLTVARVYAFGDVAPPLGNQEKTHMS